MSSLLEELEQVSDVRAEQILQSLLQPDEGIKLKTHIVAPREMSSLRVLESVLEESGMGKSAKLLRTWLDVYEMYMVSYDRKSREEIIRAVSAMLSPPSSAPAEASVSGKR